MAPEYILYIDDMLANRTLIRRLFENTTSYQVLAVENGADGIEAARLYQPTAILLDLNLVDETGESVLARLKEDEDTSHIPVIIVSVEDDPRRISNVHNLGAAAFVRKDGSLIANIRTAVEAHRQH